MTSLTLAIPNDLRERMKEHPEINWSEVARQAIKKRLEDLDFIQEFIEESDMTLQEAVTLGRELRRKVGKRILSSQTQTSSLQR
ncbi:MAG: hypothetical protein ACMXYD_03655 [Candidatus Woesearchaeota archaeon]